MYLRVLFFIATLVVFATARNEKYCNLASCKGAPHSACLYSPKDTSRACGKVVRFGLTPAEKKEIVDVHNKFRDLVASGKEVRGKPGPQPPAKNMKHLEWSDELADIAQSWANQCNYSHDTCRDTRNEEIGQNIAEFKQYGRKPASLTEIITRWYNEVANFNSRTVKAFTYRDLEELKHIGHYTQLVWAKTTHIGCALIDYVNEPPMEKRYLVCNYGPSGNFNNQPLYST